MNQRANWILNTAVATSGPLAVILVRLIGGGADAVSANPTTPAESVSLQDLHDLVLPSGELREAWARSQAVWARPRTGMPTPVVDPTPNAVDPVIAREVVLPRMVLSAVLGGSPRGAAVLNERIYWVGADLGQGWHLDRVDHQNRTVTLRHETGLEHRIEFPEGG